jgi:hypothetical protein
MKTRTHKRLFVGLALVMALSACSFTIKIPFIPDPPCETDCENSSKDEGSGALKLLLGSD